MSTRQGPYSRSMTFAAADLKDDDGIKTSIATAATAQAYSGAALNGATVVANVAYPTLGNRSQITSWPAATAAANAGSYVDASEITFTGTSNGQAVTRTATVVGTDGGATFIADGPMDTITQVDVEAQADALGSWEFGWSGIGPGYKQTTGPGTGHRRLWTVVARATGDLHVADWSSEQDTVPLVQSDPHYAFVSRIYADTAIKITIYEE